MNNELSKKHLAFIDQLFIKGYNAKKAYMAVYTKATEKGAAECASRLMQREEIQDEIERRQAILSERNEIKRDDIITDLNELIMECKSKGDRRNLLGAITLLCKMSGQFTAKQLDVNNNWKVSFGGMIAEDEDSKEEGSE